MRDVVLLIGNCQSRTIGQLLDKLPTFSERFETHFCHAVKLHRSSDLAPMHDYIEQNRSRIRLVIRQRTHGWFEDGLTPRSFLPGTEIVDYPAALLNYIWPLSSHGWHRFEANRFTKQRFPFSVMDCEVNRLRRQGVSETEFLRRYYEIDVVGKYRVDRLKRLNDFKNEEVDAMASFGSYGFVSERMQTVQMFRTENHPNGVLLAYLLRRIGEHTSLIPDRAEYARLADQVETSYGILPLEAPVHPAIAEHFGLEWARDKRFSFWGYVELTFEEYLLRMFRIESDEEYLTARDLARRGEFADARTWIDTALRRLPDNAMYQALERKIARNLLKAERARRAAPAA